MKKIITIALSLGIILFLSMAIPGKAYCKGNHKKSGSKEDIKKEIGLMLEDWNNYAKSKDLANFMRLFDDSPDIMLIGSDSAEIFKGKEQIESWLKKLFTHNSFSWEMNRVDIDGHGNTAWVFMDGKMIVESDKGKKFTTPYRFSGVLVKKDKQWKWRLFDGSVPGGH